MTNSNQTTCIECGNNIATKRNDAKYCGDRCRMRYKRQQKKIVLIAELYNLCAQIPNHVFKNERTVSSVMLFDAKKHNYEILDVNKLYSLNISQIEALIERKKHEIKVHSLASLFIRKK